MSDVCHGGESGSMPPFTCPLGVTLLRRLGRGGWMPHTFGCPEGLALLSRAGVETLTPRPDSVRYVFVQL